MNNRNRQFEPLVSIITPSYNQGRFIDETIQSVLNQDYTNIEYIVMDGGSTDNTLDILKQYERKLRWFSKRDNGQADAIHQGFHLSQGSILYWLNSDDILLPGAVQKVVDIFIKDSSIDLVYGKSYFVDSGNKIVGCFPSQPFDYKLFAIIDVIPQPSTFFTKKSYESVGGLNSCLRYAMDYDLWIRLAGRSKFYYLPEYLSNYRLHDDSKTVDKKQALLSIMETIDIVKHYYNWIPATRMYAFCYHLLEAENDKIPDIHAVKSVYALMNALIRYLQFNRNVKMDDVKYVFNLKTLKKFFTRWESLYKHY